MTAQRLIHVLWPAFIVAGVAEVVFFTAFDPAELSFLGRDITLARTTVYSVGFLVFWGFAAASSALTCFFQRTAAEINRCPINDPGQRPEGCPRREGPGGCCN